MATWDSYTQKATPEDNDTLMIKDTAGGANKRTPFSGVWNWIVKKLASAVISQLETTNKSIIPAINELNSKSKSDTTNKSKFEVKIHDKRNESFKTLLMYGATSATGFFIYLIFIDTISEGSAVTFFKISDQISGRSFTGSYDEESKTLKINCNQTLYGGVYLVIT